MKLFIYFLPSEEEPFDGFLEESLALSGEDSLDRFLEESFDCSEEELPDFLEEESFDCFLEESLDCSFLFGFDDVDILFFI
jgi:hypothetical protein